MLQISDGASVRVVRMAHGKVNTLDVELLTALRDVLDAADRENARALVLTGSGSSFSAGLDLFRIVEGGAAYVRELLPLLSDVLVRWFRYRRPVVAAINGHAIAGGAILAWCADYRIMATGSGRIGIPELRVGVPFPLVPLEIARFATGGRRIGDLVYRGMTLTAAEARASEIVDEVVAPEALLEVAVSVAEQCAAAPPLAFELAKDALRRPTLDRIARDGRAFDDRIAAEWCSVDTAQRIRSYLERTLGRTR